jgi:AcrR family transcriptional regulator
MAERKVGTPNPEESTATRQRLLDAAYHLLGTRGLEMTIGELADLARSSKGNFYYYFLTKDAVIDQVADSKVTNLKETIRIAINKPEPNLTESVSVCMVPQGDDQLWVPARVELTKLARSNGFIRATLLDLMMYRQTSLVQTLNRFHIGNESGREFAAYQMIATADRFAEESYLAQRPVTPLELVAFASGVRQHSQR